MSFRIVFDHAARDAARLSALDYKVIESAATAASVPFVVVTRTASTPEEQAQAMYENCNTYGAQSQRDLYGKFGDLVVQVFEDQRAQGVSSQASIVAAMLWMIKHIGPERVSHHCVSDWSKLHVIDLSAKRMPAVHHEAFEAALATDIRISRHFSPYTKPKDPAFHLEIGQ